MRSRSIGVSSIATRHKLWLKCACPLSTNQIQKGYVPLSADRMNQPGQLCPVFLWVSCRLWVVGMQLKQIYASAAPLFVAIGIIAMFKSSMPGVSVPGDTLEWMAAGIAMALVAKP